MEHTGIGICIFLFFQHGVIYTGQDLYHIHPLPKAYWKSSQFDIPHLIQHVRGDPNTQTNSSLTPSFLGQQEQIPFNQNERRKRSVGRKHTREVGPGGRDVKIETAVFVDRDLLRYMQTVFPTDTERHLLRFVLAMFNAVRKPLIQRHDT